MRFSVCMLLFGCTADVLQQGTDASSWEQAAIRLSTSTPEDAWPWLHDIPASSALHEDATLLSIRSLSDGEMRSTAAELASKAGPHRRDAVRLFANTFLDQPVDALSDGAVAWGLEADRAAMVLQHYQLRLASARSSQSVEQALALDIWDDSHAERSYLGAVLSTQPWASAPESPEHVLAALAPQLDPGDFEANELWVRAWLKAYGNTSWQKFLDEAPPFVDRRWALFLRGYETVQAGHPVAGLPDFEAVLEGPDLEFYTARAAFFAGRVHADQVRWGEDEAWTPHHERAVTYFERAFQQGEWRVEMLSTVGEALVRQHHGSDPASARKWLGRMESAGRRDAALLIRVGALSDELGIEPEPLREDVSYTESNMMICCLLKFTPATTLVRIFETDEGPSAIAAIPPGGSPCREPAQVLADYRPAIADCVLDDLPTTSAHDVRIEIDDEGRAIPEGPPSDVGTCLAAVAETAGVYATTWDVRILQAR